MPEKKEVTYEELMSIHRQESGNNILAKIHPELYRKAAVYIENLERRCKGEKEANSEISGMLLNQLNRAQEKTAEIYELRMRKIALLAMTSAFGAEPRLDNMAPEELDAFNTLKEFFLSHHENTLKPRCDELREYGDELKATEEPARKGKTSGTSGKSAGAGAQPEEKDENIIVRILENLPAFAGTNRNYELKKEDIISLPRNIAEILVRHNKATEIKHSL